MGNESITIEFPCDYPIKVIGLFATNFYTDVVEAVRQFAPDVEEDRITHNKSRAGKYFAMTLFIEATGEEQLKALHKSLLKNPLVKMVL